MHPIKVVRTVVLSAICLILAQAALAQISISVSFGPPPIPVYEQPICPADGYLWTPGYWAYDDDGGYYWVPGTWIQPPQVGFLWTPGYWGWGGGGFAFYEGYWGPQVGWYGGINYGFGYIGNGYAGGRWDGDHFAYNTYVTHVNATIIHNTYNTTIVNVNENRVSYNGGEGGVTARPTPQQETYASQRHVGPVAAQTQQVSEARSNPQLRATANQGKPPIAATTKPADFKTGVVASSKAGGEYKAPPANAARGNEARTPNAAARPAPEQNRATDAPKTTVTENRPADAAKAPATTNHASDLQAHKMTPPNTGNPATDKKYTAQQNTLAAKQTQDHQKLQKQQDKEHQQAAAKNYSEPQKQQLEQKHTQQTQQLEQKHATQQKQMEQKQAPPKNTSKPGSEEKAH